jgi:site-specific DNA-methyltransferase (adenine-specific)
MIYVFSKKGASYKRIDIELRCVKSVITVDTKKIKDSHPTQKPYELYEWLLKRYCPENGVVLDPTAGSFTSCTVAKDLGCKAIGIEKDLSFFYKAVGGLIKNS